MNKFLSLVARAALKGLNIVTGLGPEIRSITPNSTIGNRIDAAVDFATEFQRIIHEVEIIGALHGFTGDQKQAAAAELFAQVLLRSGFKVEDEPLFRQGCSKSASGWADILNSRKTDSAIIKEQ